MLSTDPEYEQCLELQQLTWGRDFRELVPPTILKISQKVGGVVAGALDGDGRLLGFVYGLTGVREGRLAHWSHMLAVRDEARGSGLGRRLKLFQREFLLGLGCSVMYWTFDPLVARNANLNLGSLGAVPREYVIDMYGQQTGSDLHSGLGTDRFVVEWRFGDPEVADRIARGERWCAAAPLRGARVVAPGGDLDGALAAVERERPRELWVEIPPDIDRLKSEDRGRALSWRDAMRGSMVWALANGYRVSGIAGDLRADGRVWYRLERTAS
ncbi:MAG TPA: GNAT family N-acetyltransferase [Thermoanaerobaculia bacterium]|nr:GNAT family N-acetyltransferase [Thermoanaerobaculia bacterium]